MIIEGEGSKRKKTTAGERMIEMGLTRQYAISTSHKQFNADYKDLDLSYIL